MRFWLILAALLGLMLGWAFGQEGEPARPGLPLVEVELKSGRHFTAAIDPRTSPRRLWIRFGTTTLRVVRPIDWQCVDRIVWRGASYTPAEFLPLLAKLRKDAGPAVEPKPASPARQQTESARAASAPEQLPPGGFVPMNAWAAVGLGHGPAVQRIDAHARLLPGLRTGRRPRYRLVVAPRGGAMQDVPALGTLSVELWGYRRSIEREVLLHRWTRNVTPAQYTPLGAAVDLEVPAGLADPWPNLAGRGKLVVRFSVAGQGVFETEVPGVPIP